MEELHNCRVAASVGNHGSILTISALCLEFAHSRMLYITTQVSSGCSLQHPKGMQIGWLIDYHVTESQH